MWNLGGDLQFVLRSDTIQDMFTNVIVQCPGCLGEVRTDPCKRCWGVGSVIKIVQVPDKPARGRVEFRSWKTLIGSCGRKATTHGMTT